MPIGNARVGPDAIVNNLFVKLGSEWDGFSVHPKSFHDAGDSVIVEIRYGGTILGTGKSMDTQDCHVWDFKDAAAPEPRSDGDFCSRRNYCCVLVCASACAPAMWP